MCIVARRFFDDVRVWRAGATHAGSHSLPGLLRPSARRRSKNDLKQALRELKRLQASRPKQTPTSRAA